MEKHILVEMLSQITPLTEEEQLDIQNSFPIQTCDKGTYLLKEGQIARDAYFVITGCVREYRLLDGEEKTTEFYTENQSIANFSSMLNQSPSVINYVCAEETTLTILNADLEKKLYSKHPRFESFCRDGVEQMMGQKQQQLAEYITLKPEQRYQKLQDERPDLINRVPQYHIASYLGIKPETLSRIRARLTP